VHNLHALPELDQSLEVLWVEPGNTKLVSERTSPTLVFLHEGLGSITQWRDFPQSLCDSVGLKGLVYARQGYGLSSFRKTPAYSDFMHIEAHQVLPALLTSLNIERPILIGHSDGGSIALLFAAWAERQATSQTQSVTPSSSSIARPLGLCVLAPHLFVEDDGVSSIAIARKLFDADPSFRERLGRHHRDVVHTFNNWANVWLSQNFKSWNIEAEVAQISCPILAIQGCDDQYGSLAQIRRISELASASRAVELLEIPHCKHSPHLEHRTSVIDACTRFLRQCVT
jgi:pimeloyl-ACP methyl ester carboxylesterase